MLAKNSGTHTYHNVIFVSFYFWEGGTDAREAKCHQNGLCIPLSLSCPSLVWAAAGGRQKFLNSASDIEGGDGVTQPERREKGEGEMPVGYFRVDWRC